MKNLKIRPEWAKFTEVFNEKYNGRATRLGLFERQHNITTDYWLENGLPFVGVGIDNQGELPEVRISIGTLSHAVTDAVSLSFKLTADGEGDGLEVQDRCFPSETCSTALYISSRV